VGLYPFLCIKRSLHGLTHIRHNGRNIPATHRKHTHKTLTRHKNILYYTRYVYDILIICDTRHISDNTIQKYINQIHKNLQLNQTHEDNGQINFLDLTIIRNNSTLEIDIHRKPITTKTTINYDSNHPTEHKTAAYRQYTKRMQSLPLTTERQKTEWKTIKTIANSNNFPDKVITQLKSQKHTKHGIMKQTQTKTKNGQFSPTTFQE